MILNGNHMKKAVICLVALAMAGITHAASTTNYVPDGQFESPNGDVGPWVNTFGGDGVHHETNQQSGGLF